MRTYVYLDEVPEVRSAREAVAKWIEDAGLQSDGVSDHNRASIDSIRFDGIGAFIEFTPFTEEEK